MARVDYEAAWDELQELILSRDGWGTRTLTTEMAHLRVKHKIVDASASADRRVEPAGRAPGDTHTEDPEEDRDGRAEPPGNPQALRAA